MRYVAGIWLQSFVSSAVDGTEWLGLHAGRSTPWETTVLSPRTEGLVPSIAGVSFLRKRETLAHADSHTTILVKKFPIFYETRSFISVLVTGCQLRMLGIASPGIRKGFVVIRLVFRRVFSAVFRFTTLNYFCYQCANRMTRPDINMAASRND